MLGDGKQQTAAFSYAAKKFNHATLFSEQGRHAPLFTEQWSSEQCSIATLIRPDRVRLSKIKKNIFYFLIMFYSLDDVIFVEFDHNSNLFLIIFYKLCCYVLKKPRKLSDVFQT